MANDFDTAAREYVDLLAQEEQWRADLQKLKEKLAAAKADMLRFSGNGAGNGSGPGSAKTRHQVAAEVFRNDKRLTIRPEDLIEPFRQSELLSKGSLADDAKAAGTIRQYLASIRKKGWVRGPKKAKWTAREEGLTEMEK